MPKLKAGLTRFFIFVFIALFSVSPILSAKEKLSSNEFFQRASSLFIQNKEAAKKQFKIFPKYYPRDPLVPEAAFMVAECTYGLDSVSNEALVLYQKILSKYSSNLVAESSILRIAEIYYNARDFIGALDWLDKAESRYPKSYLQYEIKLLKSNCFVILGRFKEAKDTLDELTTKRPAYKEDKRFNYVYGLVNYQLENYDVALENLNKIDSPEALLFASKCLVELKKPLYSIEKLQLMIKKYPESIHMERAQYLIPEAFFVAKDYLSAIQSYEKFLQNYPRSVLRGPSIFKIGCSYLELNDNLQARSNFQSFLQLEPQAEFAPFALYLIGESFLREERYKEASFAYGDMIDSYSGNFYEPNAQLRLGWCYYKLNDYQKAKVTLTMFRQLFSNNPLLSQAEMLLGNVLSELKEYSAAASAYQRVIDKSRDTNVREAALALMSKSNYLAENYTALVSGYRYILNTFPPSNNPWRLITYLYIGEGYLKQGLYKEAAELYKTAESVYPTDEHLIYAKDGLAWADFFDGKYEEAEEIRLKIQNLARQEELPQELLLSNKYEMANALFNQKKYLKALDIYNEISTQHSKHDLAASAAFRSGLCYYELEYFSQAIETWLEVEKNYPDKPEAAESLWKVADTYFRAQFYDNAVKSFEKIMAKYSKNDEENARAQLRIAQCYYNSKRNDLAVGALKTLIEKYPDEQKSFEALDFLIAILETSSTKDSVINTMNEMTKGLGTDKPISIEIRFRLARYYFDAKDYVKAVIVLEGLTSELKDKEKFADSNFYLAVSYYKLSEFPKAAAAFKRFVENFPEDKRTDYALFHLGSSNFKAKMFAEAAEGFEKLIQDYPASEYIATALYNAAMAYREIKNWEKAASLLQMYQKRFATGDEALSIGSQLALLYEEQNQFMQAIEILNENRAKADKKSETWGELTFRVAEDYVAAGSIDKGMAAYQELVDERGAQVDSWAMSSMVRLGEHYEKNNDSANALLMYQKIIEKSKFMKEKPSWIESVKAKVEAMKSATKP